MEKPTPAALAAFDAAFPDDGRAERRKMFGMPAGFVNGNMFCGVFHDGVVLRLPAERIAALGAEEGVGAFEPMEGRPWKDYIHASAPRWGGTATLAGWAQEALAHTAATLPPKEPKPKKARS
ncbi:MAG: TfoX/Sxy family protein [Myxococcales bacterium]|nr:TfoX/Sxy family protein [Myxococcales bacterium]